MNLNSRLSIEILKLESPFFISDICDKYEVTPDSVSHFISRRKIHFKVEEIRTGVGGRPSKLFTYIENVTCPSCGYDIRIEDLQ